MNKSFLLLTTILSFNASVLSASAFTPSADKNFIAESNISEVSSLTSTTGQTDSRVTASAEDLKKINAHLRSYGEKLGLPSNVEAVGNVGCCSLLSTTFKDAERFLLNEFAGQLLTRFLALALDDLADGILDGVAYGKRVSYAQEVAALLGVTISEDELKAAPQVDSGLLVRLVGFSIDVTKIIIETQGQKDKLIAAAGAFAKEKMEKARKSIAVALIQETDRIISLELGNGKVDGLNAEGVAIDWKKEMQDSVQRALSRVLDSVM